MVANLSSPDYGGTFRRPSSNKWGNRICWRPGNGHPVSVTNMTARTWANKSEFAFCPIYYDSVYDISEWKVHTASAANSSTWDRVSEATFEGRTRNSYGRRVFDVGIQPALENIAEAFTQAGLEASNTTIQGTVCWPEIYVSVNWLWLLLPAVLVVLGVVFLVLTVLVNRRQRLSLWKSSILAVLFHGIADLEVDEEDKYGTVSRMDQAARSLEVKLTTVDQRKGLMLYQS